MVLYRKSHIPDAPYSYVVDPSAAPKDLLPEQNSVAKAVFQHLAPNQVSTPPEGDAPNDIEHAVNDNTVYIEKFEDVGMLDPSGSSHHKPAPHAKPGAKPAPGSPSKKKENAGKPSLKNIDFNKPVYPDCKMENPHRPPTMVYIPTADLMRKMIKACIKVETSAEILAKI